MRWPGWTGLGERRFKKSPDEEVQPPKTAWDFLQLLIVPAILVAIALVFNASQASREHKREDRRIREDRALAKAAREDATLDAYFTKMSSLILGRGLTRAKRGSDVRQVARTETLATLRRLDGTRKGEVVKFLFEAGLLSGTLERAAVIDLGGADLRGLDLADADLYGEYGKNRILLDGDLRGARFDHARLVQVDFPLPVTGKTDLRGASFNGAELWDTRLMDADLRDASFQGATLTEVNFGRSDLRGTSFDGASIEPGVRFNATCVSNASFVGTTFNVQSGGAYYANPKTTFLDAWGHDVDFSDAVNLSSVRLSLGVNEARFDGADERPKRTPRLPFQFKPTFCR